MRPLDYIKKKTEEDQAKSGRRAGRNLSINGEMERSINNLFLMEVLEHVS